MLAYARSLGYHAWGPSAIAHEAWNGRSNAEFREIIA